MSSSQVILTVTKGPLRGSRHVFDERRLCKIGRAADCDIQLLLPGSPFFANISRHHCELDLDPPAVRVRDLGSRNGTWLNGQRLNQGAYVEDQAAGVPGDFVTLKDGDELQIGSTTMRLRILATDEIPEAKVELAFAG